MQVIINPGSGPVTGSTEKEAIENIKHFITDCEITDINWVRIPGHDYGEGRYAFLLWKDVVCHEIQMPGLSLDKVRWIDGADQNIWDFPRLYVDGGSWVWKFALLNKVSEWEINAEEE